MIYLDSSALVTIVVERPHAKALRRFLDTRATEKLATSTIGMIETVRTCDRLGNYPNLLPRLLREHTEITVTGLIRDAAANVPGPVRSLDAIHIASAEALGRELTALVTYDKRMAETARQNGLPVAMPGLE
ncbi:MAG TPA: type II toxin-antitoxin system VapC family toxin [Actinophytocola sp.]|uniref:type II toxin-antitoxin system VapC family toxin n=1 Tax=Actinophytocola sp. TaxID=1872138 RepID=UPI002DBCDB8A|nr:type II toxin-antitoxin system VapC family toxin [Actinophytocola sp.]HEU5475156.1 type II toxin-antitoxin system VapC family toxin [Actinophytocola sp.]